MTLRHFLFFAASSLLALLAACNTTRQSTNQTLSGFLSNYDRMGRAEAGKAAVWRNPDFEVGDYSGILVPEVELWDVGTGQGQSPDAMDPEDAVRLAILFRQTTVEELEAKGWKIALAPGPGVARLRLALTELNGANRFGNILTTVPYASTQAVGLTSSATDVRVFMAKASAEMQLLDSATGVILAEAYDRRVGNKKLTNLGSTWGAVEEAIGIFSKRIAEGLSKAAR